MKKTATRARNGMARSQRALARLYREDEVAWLDRTAELARARRFDEIDHRSLAEYLEDMARRDRREVKNRLVTLMLHLLKWQFQPAKRTRSWATTIAHQRFELEDAVDITTLRNHAVDVLPTAYRRATRLASKETGLEESHFPEACPFSLDFLLSDELPGGDVTD